VVLANGSVEHAAGCAMCMQSGVLLSGKHELDGASSALIEVLPGSNLLVVQPSLLGLGCASSGVRALGVARDNTPVAPVYGPTRKLIIPVRACDQNVSECLRNG